MCINVNILSKKYSIPAKKLFIIASLSGAQIQGNDICGDLNEVLIEKYKYIENMIKNDEIVILDDVRFVDLFKNEYNIVRAYNKLFVTRRVPIPLNILSRYPEIKKNAILLGNRYYITPSQYLKLKILMQKDNERVETIVIDVD